MLQQCKVFNHADTSQELKLECSRLWKIQLYNFPVYCCTPSVSWFNMCSEVLYTIKYSYLHDHSLPVSYVNFLSVSVWITAAQWIIFYLFFSFLDTILCKLTDCNGCKCKEFSILKPLFLAPTTKLLSKSMILHFSQFRCLIRTSIRNVMHFPAATISAWMNRCTGVFQY